MAITPLHDTVELLDTDERNAIQQEILEAGTHTLEPVSNGAAVDTIKTQLALIAAAGHWDDHLRASLEIYLLTVNDPHGLSIEDEFKRFSIKESITSGKLAQHLVRPSGKFASQAKLGIFVHYPTWKTQHPSDGETSDATNCCMLMLLKKVLSPGDGEIDQWELWHRRESTVGRKRHECPYENNSAVLKEIHADFVMQRIHLSNAKVFLLVGRWVQVWYLGRVEDHIKTLTVNDVVVHVVVDQNDVQRIAVECPHPENIFFDDGIAYGGHIDAAITVAVGLAGSLSLRIEQGYFENNARIIASKEVRKGKLWSLGPHDSRVMLACRMLRWEQAHQSSIPIEDIPPRMIDAFAMSAGISFDKVKETLGSNGQSLAMAIHQSYTAASHAKNQQTEWTNLKRGLETQESRDFLSLKRGAITKAAQADTRRTEQGLTAIIRSTLQCQKCPKYFISRQGLFEHNRVEHEGFRYMCTIKDCGKGLKNSSSLKKHMGAHAKARS